MLGNFNQSDSQILQSLYKVLQWTSQNPQFVKQQGS